MVTSGASDYFLLTAVLVTYGRYHAFSATGGGPQLKPGIDAVAGYRAEVCQTFSYLFAAPAAQRGGGVERFP